MNKTISSRGHITTLDMIYVAVGAVLISVCSWISIPTTVPFTLQTFAVFTVLLMLGGERGTLSVLVYIIMGAVGFPVFSNFTGGMGALIGSTGGYIIGFLFMGLIHIAFTKFIGEKTVVELISMLVGLAVCYTFGTAWFMFVYMKNTGPVGVITVLSWCVFPFIIPDLLKLVLAFSISKKVRPRIMKG